MKRSIITIVSLLLLCAMLFSVSCVKKAESTETTAKEKEETTKETEKKETEAETTDAPFTVPEFVNPLP